MRSSKRWQRGLAPVAALCGALLAAEVAADEPPKTAEPAKESAPVKSRVIGSDPGSSEADARRAQLDDARRRLAEAASEVARLSAGVYGTEHHVRMLAMPFGGRKAMLGVLIGGEAEGRGVPVVGVTPGGPAARAGLREDDVIVRIDDVPLAAATVDEALGKLTGHLAELEPGARVRVEILRGGERRTEEIELAPPAELDLEIQAFGDGPGLHLLPGAGGLHKILHRQVFETHAFSDVELVSLTEGLGRYFGTSQGLLVVRAPSDARIGLEDGDVILEIDGRQPKDPAHAVRILGSYGEGESLQLEIQRSRSTRTLDIQL